MRRMVSVLAMACSISIANVDGASAGGWWSFLDLPKKHVVAGETIRVRSTEVLFRSIDEARRAVAGIDRYYAYLLPTLDWRIVDRAMAKGDPGDWWVPPSVAIRLEHVRFTHSDANLVKAEATFTVPQIGSGSYAVMFCTESCVTPLGDVVPTRVVVAADALTAKTALGLARLRSRVDSEVEELGGELGALSVGVSSRIAAMEGSQMRRDIRARGFERRITILAQQVAAARTLSGWLLALGGLLALVAVAMILVLMRRNPARSGDSDSVVPDLTELEEVGSAVRYGELTHAR